MRTLEDLSGAFTLLERAADGYATRTETDAHDDLHLRRHGQPGPRSRATVVAAALVAAATVAALAVAAGTWGSSDHDRPAGGTTSTVDDQPAPKTLGVTVDPDLGMTVLEVSTAATATTLSLYNTRQHADVTITPASAGNVVTPGLDPVDVDGNPGYYTDGTRPMFVEPPSDPASDPDTAPAPATPTPPDTRYAKAVVWRYAPDAYAFVLFQGSSPGEAALLRVARAVHFGGTHPIRSAVRLSAAPSGMHVVDIDSAYHEADDNAPFLPVGSDWATRIGYEPYGGAEGFEIEATSADLTSDWQDGQSLTIDGRPAYWFATRHELDLDAGNGAYVSVSERSADYRSPETETLAQLRAVAETLTITAHPTDPATWFEASQAAP